MIDKTVANQIYKNCPQSTHTVLWGFEDGYLTDALTGFGAIQAIKEHGMIVFWDYIPGEWGDDDYWYSEYPEPATTLPAIPFDHDLVDVSGSTHVNDLDMYNVHADVIELAKESGIDNWQMLGGALLSDGLTIHPPNKWYPVARVYVAGEGWL